MDDYEPNELWWDNYGKRWLEAGQPPLLLLLLFIVLIHVYSCSLLLTIIILEPTTTAMDPDMIDYPATTTTSCNYWIFLLLLLRLLLIYYYLVQTGKLQTLLLFYVWRSMYTRWPSDHYSEDQTITRPHWPYWRLIVYSVNQNLCGTGILATNSDRCQDHTVGW